jgi:hypothetical protein
MIYVLPIAGTAQQMTNAQLNTLLTAAQTAIKAAYPTEASAIINQNLHDR